MVLVFQSSAFCTPRGEDSAGSYSPRIQSRWASANPLNSLMKPKHHRSLLNSWVLDRLSSSLEMTRHQLAQLKWCTSISNAARD